MSQAKQHTADAPVTALRGVGARVAEKLAAHGLTSIKDLWFFLPKQYEDLRHITPIAALAAGSTAQVEGVVENVQTTFRYRPQMKVAISDDSGASLTLRFFHFRQTQSLQFKHGVRVRCHGDIRQQNIGLEIIHPNYTILDEDHPEPLPQSISPVYPDIKGIGALSLKKIMTQALDALPNQDPNEPASAALAHFLQGLPSLHQALHTVHRPHPDDDLDALLERRHPAIQRLAFEELVAHQLSIRQRRFQQTKQAAFAMPMQPDAYAQLQAQFGFQLTDAQTRVSAEIHHDMTRSHPMHRLVQGDVGSGKTVVAAMAVMHALANGHQAALIAPTELLAEQHANNFRRWLEPLGHEVVWLAGKVKGKKREQALAALRSPKPLLAVGTHALIQEQIAFAQLGLVIIDEQHRFGVGQRLELSQKGSDDDISPHQLIMTATPIPRTLAMSMYADLDVSVIDSLPPGRKPIQTVVMSDEKRDELIERIKHRCAEGAQVYWVCTLIEDNAEIAAQAAETRHQELAEALPELTVLLVHGRMKPQEKEQIMQQFAAGDAHVLVATTVIEVGVDVPNATVMIIENAERLGLAQLHQLRGRVGRGDQASSCALLYRRPLSPLAKQRLAILRQTNDGFEIAEKDLSIRGAGELLGTKQTGVGNFKIADLHRDQALLPSVQAAADHLLEHAPDEAEVLIKRFVGQAVRYANA